MMITHRTRGIGSQIYDMILDEVLPDGAPLGVQGASFCSFKPSGVDRSAEKIGLPGGHTQQQTASAVLWKRAGARLRHGEC